MFPVSEETATPDDVGNFRRNHLVPAFVPAADALETPRENMGRYFGLELSSCTKLPRQTR